MKVPFEYAVLRVVPRVERGESVNAGVVVYCRDRGYLGARVALDVDRVRALDPGVDVAAVGAVLHAATLTCDGTGGPATGDDIGRRFRWLTAPRSTVVQPGPVHTGLTDDPAAELDRLLQVLVAPVAG
ncbi:DUF3037 domain-containing protein [uncultured Jatrophihabitans sp.]|uniref:DUF3037 domain-containing protein n=1 Tax=uncultured Jatrophihabitans sp. TaxID=1610747 RepID=UPI0035CA3C21